MIIFADKDDNKQFISIDTDGSASIDTIVNKLKRHYTSLKQLHIVCDECEILIPLVTGYHYGFSLNELREYMKPIVAATVTHFAVDMDEPTQRYFG